MAARPLRPITTEEIDAFHRDGLAAIAVGVNGETFHLSIRRGHIGVKFVHIVVLSFSARSRLATSIVATAQPDNTYHVL